MSPRKRGEPTVALNVRLKPHVVKVIEAFALVSDIYIYQAVEALILRGLESMDVSVEALLDAADEEERWQRLKAQMDKDGTYFRVQKK